MALCEEESMVSYEEATPLLSDKYWPKYNLPHWYSLWYHLRCSSSKTADFTHSLWLSYDKSKNDLEIKRSILHLARSLHDGPIEWVQPSTLFHLDKVRSSWIQPEQQGQPYIPLWQLLRFRITIHLGNDSVQKSNGNHRGWSLDSEKMHPLEYVLVGILSECSVIQQCFCFPCSL